VAATRPPAAAGLFYPAEPAELRRAVDGLLATAPVTPLDIDPQLLIVPHAGYIYSGAVAARAYRVLMGRDDIRAVILVGPSHFVRIEGIATSGTERWRLPTGDIAMDVHLLARAEGHPAVDAIPEAHRREHSLEVQFPFLQAALTDFTALPIVTGDVDPEVVAGLLDDLLSASTLALVSSDLSHYLEYTSAQEKDARTAEAIAHLRPDEIRFDDACGHTAIQAALHLAKRRGWRCRRLALCNSGDTAGSPSRVVGYGAFALGPPTGSG